MSKTSTKLQTRTIKVFTVNPVYTLITLISTQFKVTASAEIEVLYNLYNFSNSKPMTITADVRRQLCELSGTKDTALGVALFRLNEKGAITKDGKMVTLHPAYTKLDEVEMICFQLEKK